MSSSHVIVGAVHCVHLCAILHVVTAADACIEWSAGMSECRFPVIAGRECNALVTSLRSAQYTTAGACTGT